MFASRSLQLTICVCSSLYICVQCLSHHPALPCHRNRNASISKETGKDMHVLYVCVCLDFVGWGGLLVFRQSCYKHQKHQWAAFSKALQNPLAIMSPSPPPKSLWKLWSRWSPIDCNDSYSDRQQPAGQQSHQSPTAFNDSRRSRGTIARAATELTVSVQ